jgi:hypothetical protein
LTGYVKFDGYGLKDNAALLCSYNASSGLCSYDYVDFDGYGLKRYTATVGLGVSCYDTAAVYFDGRGIVKKTTSGYSSLKCGQ